MKLLITGFEPFGGESVNPSYEAVKRLPSSMEGHELIRLRLPVDFFSSAEILLDALATHRPAAVLSVGQAGGRTDIALEKVALNQAWDRNADPPLCLAADHRIAGDGPAAYFSTLPLDAIERALRAEEIPASVSLSAGTYVCNFIMYTALHRASREGAEMRCGFIHVPFLPEQAAAKTPPAPSMTLDTITKAIETAVQAIIRTME